MLGKANAQGALAGNVPGLHERISSVETTEKARRLVLQTLWTRKRQIIWGKQGGGSGRP
jgi:hypothetical protein